MSFSRLFVLAVAISTLFACGGSGSGSEPDRGSQPDTPVIPTPDNPVVNPPPVDPPTNPPPVDPPVSGEVDTIVAAQEQLLLSVGQMRVVDVRALDVDGRVVSTPLAWMSENPSVVEVTPEGEIIAVGVGTARIFVKDAAEDGKANASVLVSAAELGGRSIILLAEWLTGAPEIIAVAPEGQLTGSQIRVTLESTAPELAPNDLVVADDWSFFGLVRCLFSLGRIPAQQHYTSKEASEYPMA